MTQIPAVFFLFLFFNVYVPVLVPPFVQMGSAPR